MNVSLRPLEDGDLDTIYQQVTDPESAPGRGEEIEETILRLD
jgi:hypothetical protein